MTTNRKRERLSPVFLILAVITLALSSWGLYRLFVDHADMPQPLALLVVGGLDLAAVAFGKHALTVAEDGDSSLPWNFGLFVLTGLGSYAQLAVHLLRGDALAVGLVSMAFPIVTVALFEGQLRRRFRLQGRRTGRVPEPRASVDLMTWVFYRALALRATKLAVLDRGLDPDTAVMLAERQLALEAADADTPVRARRMRRSYARELASGDVIDTVHVPAVRTDGNVGDPDVWGDADTEPDSPDDEVRERRTLSAVVADARAEVGDRLDDVFAVVQTVRPDASRETVGRTLRRQLGNAS